MARAKKADNTQRRLLSVWQPPDSAGEAIGVLATTFTLDTALFEEECLARFAGVQSDPARDGAIYRIEREERLASLLCAVVVADIHHCGGRRSLRWDLLAARPASGVMHAKISLMAWSNHVRVVVGSANLTNDGYRRNQESLASLDFHDAFTDRALLDPLLDYLRELLAITSGPARERAETLLQWVDQRLPKHVSPTKGLLRRVVLVGPGRSDFFNQLSEIVPAGAPPGESHVVSPFFDPTLREAGPERKLWGMMKQRGAANVHLHVAGQEAPETGGWRLAVPAHVLQATPKGRAEVGTELHPVRVDDVQTEYGRDRLPLHAKTLYLTHETWALLTVGSSNFTSAGTGLSPYAKNYEANVVYFVKAPVGDKWRGLLEARQIRGGAPVGKLGAIEFAPAFDPDAEGAEPLPPLPRFFDEAALNGTTSDGYLLTVRLSGGAPEGKWSVLHDNLVLFDDEDWLARGRPATIDLTLKRDGPPPSTLQVRWGASSYSADWPVNVTSAAALPAPSELQGLSLAALLDLLSSARPLHEALRAWLRRQPDDDDAEVDQAVELVDPHAKVDTSGFLIKRVQRACWAIRQLGERMTQPVLSASAMAWRLSGPVGASAVLDAIERQCDPDLPDERVFLLCEMWREMRSVVLKGVGDHPVPPESHELMAAFVERLRSALQHAGAACSDPMRSYLNSAAMEDDYAPA
jgi:hypothetical protein